MKRLPPAVINIDGVRSTLSRVASSISCRTSASTPGSLASACTFFCSAAVSTVATVSHTWPLIAQVAWLFQELAVEDVAVSAFDHDAQRVALFALLVRVVEKGSDVRVRARHHALE